MLGGLRQGVCGDGGWAGAAPPAPELSTVCFTRVPPPGSIRAGRRSSYLLAITTERSKSCDDGLNAFRDEGKILR